jgi:hypothetical protein
MAEARHEEGRVDGRADMVHGDGRKLGEIASIEVDRAATIVIRAASSCSVGVPRTTLTSSSSSIDRAYDVTGMSGDTRPTLG